MRAADLVVTLGDGVDADRAAVRMGSPGGEHLVRADDVELLDAVPDRRPRLSFRSPRRACLRTAIALSRLSLGFGHMRAVAAVIDQGALTFDFAIPCEIFGLDRSDIVDPWYEFLVVAAGDRRVRTQTGFVLEAPHGLEALERADTIVVPGWADPEEEPSDALEGRPRACLRPGCAARLGVHRRVRSGRSRAPGRQARDHALDVRRATRPSVPEGRARPGRPLSRGRARVSPPPARRPGSTCACTSSRSTTAWRWRPRSRAGSSCRCTGSADRRSTWTRRSPPTQEASERCSTGAGRISTRASRWTTSSAARP